VRFNEMLKSWHDQMKKLKDSYANVEARMNLLEKSCLQEQSADKALMIVRMKHDLEKMQNVLGRFAV
jgi:uncharacterized membrane protein YobD (UPF0266 family)